METDRILGRCKDIAYMYFNDEINKRRAYEDIADFNFNVEIQIRQGLDPSRSVCLLVMRLPPMKDKRACKDVRVCLCQGRNQNPQPYLQG